MNGYVNLLMRLSLSVFGIAELGNFLQHRLHQGGSQLLKVGWLSLVCLTSRPTIVVEGREVVKEVTSSPHIPVQKQFPQLISYKANH